MVGTDGDWSLPEIGKVLEARGVRWSLINTRDFPLEMGMNVQLDVDGLVWHGELAAGDGPLQLAEVTAVYYGKPRDFKMPAELSGPELRFARAQARMGFGGVLASLPTRWVNHPTALADAAYKPRQLTWLRRAGLVTPPTLITNQAGAVREFAARYGDLVVKPLAEPVVWEDGAETVVYTRRLRPEDLSCLDGVGSTAHLFQQWQHKRFETRVTAVGDQLFAVAIHAGSDRAHIDWRSDYDSLRYEVVEVPDRVRAGIFRYLDIAGLTSSVFDFVVRPDRAWVALEANGAGMWGWLAAECELPIAEAFAGALMKE